MAQNKKKDAESYNLASEESITSFESKEIDFLNKIREFKKKHKISVEEFMLLVELPSLSVPVSIFKSDIPPLEAVVLYLNRSYSLKKISMLLKRSQKTVWTTLTNARKRGLKLDISGTKRVPLSILADRQFSILESITKYLKEEKGLRLIDIANLLAKDRRLVWTVYDRAKKKMQSKEKKKDAQG